MFHASLIFFYVKWRGDRRERKRSASIHWFIHQICATTRAGRGQSQGNGALFRFPTWVAGATVFELSSAASQDALVESWIASGLTRSRTSTPI